MSKCSKMLALLMVMTFIASSGFSGEKYKVAYVARAQNDAFAAWLANSIREEVATNYPDMTVSVFDGQSNNEIISAHIENAIVNKYDAILLQPFDTEANRYPLLQAVEAGLVGVCVNVQIEDPRLGNVDANPYDQAAVNAVLAVDQVPQNANVVVLLGPAGNPHALERRRAWQEVFFDKRPDVKIVGEQIANWMKDEAMRHMEDWIQATGGKIDAIIAVDDYMCAGAITAAKDAKLGKLLAYGVDGTAEACLLIKDGYMTSTSLQSAYDLAKASVKLVHDMLKGGKPEVIMIDCPLITAENADEYIKLHERVGSL